MKEKRKLDGRDTYTPRGVPHGKSIIIKGEEKKMDISTKNVKLLKFGKGLVFTTQFLPSIPHGTSLGV